MLALALKVGDGMQNINGVMSQAYWVKPATATAPIVGLAVVPPRSASNAAMKVNGTERGVARAWA